MRFIAVTGCLALAVGLVFAPTSGIGEQTGSPAYAVSGSNTYRTYCASCHGEKGRGDGPLADNLQFHPADLTRLARRNGGKYPTETIRRIVDGRESRRRARRSRHADLGRRLQERGDRLRRGAGPAEGRRRRGPREDAAGAV